MFNGDLSNGDGALGPSDLQTCILDSFPGDYETKLTCLLCKTTCFQCTELYSAAVTLPARIDYPETENVLKTRGPQEACKRNSHEDSY